MNTQSRRPIACTERTLPSPTCSRACRRPTLRDCRTARTGSWPDATEEALFVSPLRPGCEERFSFTLNGEIRASSPTDAAATKTIERLGLNHALMNQFRKAAIEATLGMRGRGLASLDLHSARARLNGLRAAEENRGSLEPFCFVLKQAIRKHICSLLGLRSM